MTARTDPAALLWAAVLCAGLALWVARAGGDAGRRARRLVDAAEAEFGRSVLERVGDVIAGVRSGQSWRPAGSAGLPDWLRRRLTRWAGAERRRRRSGRRRLRGPWVGPERRKGRTGAVGWRWAVRAGPELLCLPLGVVLGGVTRSAVPALAGAVAVPLVGRALRRRSERAAAERGAVAVGLLCGTVAGDLRAGRPPHAALADALESGGWPRSAELAEAGRLVLSAARFGGDVPQALRAAARLQEGAQGLAAVAACWQVAVDGGAGLAAALDRVAAALRAEADQREDLRAQLAGPRSTAVLLALLPGFGLVLGAGLGADPAAVLLHTPAGLCCLGAGTALEWAGLAWTARIIRVAEGRPVRKTVAAGVAERGPS